VLVEKVKFDENQEKERRLPPCTLAAEWAEHARFYGDDEPCDDGRAYICGNRKGEGGLSM
jgi:hypothetical protein